MVKHIVLWKLKDEADGRTKAENALRIRDALQSLRGCVAGMRHLEVGINIERSEFAYDIALYSEFDDEAALAAYQVHPKHVAFKEFIRSLRTARAVVDYPTALPVSSSAGSR